MSKRTLAFIKRLCYYAKGFEYKRDRGCDPHIRVEDRDWNMCNETFAHGAYFPLLIHRAVDGWNSSCNPGERILEVVGGQSQRYLKWGRSQNIISLDATDIEDAYETALYNCIMRKEDNHKRRMR